MLPTPVSTIRNEGFASKFDFNQSVPAITKVYYSIAFQFVRVPVMCYFAH